MNKKKTDKLNLLYSELYKNKKIKISDIDCVAVDKQSKLFYLIIDELFGDKFDTTIEVNLKKQICDSINDKKKDINWDELYVKYKNIYKKITSTKEITYYLLIPLFINISNIKYFLFKSIKIKKVKFNICDFQKCHKRFENLQTGIDHGDFQKDKHGMIYLEGELKKSNIIDQEAIEEIYSAFKELQALINYAYWRYVYSNRSKITEPYNLIINPPFYFYKNNIQNIVHTMENYIEINPKMKKVGSIHLSKNAKDTFLKTKIIFQTNKPSELEITLIRAITMYSDALSESDRSLTFLNLWRMCEYATQPHKDETRTKHVVENIRPYFKDIVYKYTGEKIERLRHNLVHKNIFDHFNDRCIIWTKEYADALIDILLFLRNNKFKKNIDVKNFFELYPIKDTKELKNISKLCKILKQRLK